MVLWLGGEKQWNARAAENVSSPRLIETRWLIVLYLL